MVNLKVWKEIVKFRNLSELECDLSRSLKVICDDVIGLSIVLSY